MAIDPEKLTISSLATGQFYTHFGAQNSQNNSKLLAGDCTVDITNYTRDSPLLLVLWLGKIFLHWVFSCLWGFIKNVVLSASNNFPAFWWEQCNYFPTRKLKETFWSYGHLEIGQEVFKNTDILITFSSAHLLWISVSNLQLWTGLLLP